MKCKYNKTCSGYDEVNTACTKNGGEYYGDGRYCGTYRNLEDKNGRSK